MAQAKHPSRRSFLQAGAATAAVAALRGAPAIVVSAAERPQALQGLQLGDPHDGAIVVWSRSDRAARMLVEWSYDEQFASRSASSVRMRSRQLISPRART